MDIHKEEVAEHRREQDEVPLINQGSHNDNSDVQVEIKPELVDEENPERPWLKETEDKQCDVSRPKKMRMSCERLPDCEECRLGYSGDCPRHGPDVYKCNNTEVRKKKISCKNLYTKISQADEIDKKGVIKEEVDQTSPCGRGTVMCSCSHCCLTCSHGDHYHQDLTCLKRRDQQDVPIRSLSVKSRESPVARDKNRDKNCVATAGARERHDQIRLTGDRVTENIRDCQTLDMSYCHSTSSSGTMSELDSCNSRFDTPILSHPSTSLCEDEFSNSGNNSHNLSVPGTGVSGCTFCNPDNNLSLPRTSLSENESCNSGQDTSNISEETSYGETGSEDHGTEYYDTSGHLDEKPFMCDVCHVGFSQAGHLRRHMRIHTGEKPYKCDICGVEFSRTDRLKNHIKIHTGEKPYKCDVCDIGFIDKKNLQSHKKTHSGDKPFKCKYCGIGFTHTAMLNRHTRTHTGESPYKCDLCEEGFNDSYSLKMHKGIHVGARPYKCDICGVAFFQTHHLKRHKRSHTGERPYICDICGSSFSQSCDLSNHKRTHTGEKPFKCEFCYAGFSQLGILNRHKRIHTGEKPYKCDVCGMGFSRSCHVDIHMRTHTGEKPYKCDICGLCFSQVSNMNTHKIVHMTEKFYTCEMCGEQFSHTSLTKRSKPDSSKEEPVRCGVCEAHLADSVPEGSLTNGTLVV